MFRKQLNGKTQVNTSGNKKAFTLIELLVVIAIIALLLSILLPSLKLAKEKAKTILCKTNLKSYHLAMTLYLNDNDTKYPYSHTCLINGSPAGDRKQCQWHNKNINPEVNPQYAGPLYSYLGTMKTSLCPTFLGFSKYSGHTSCDVEYNPQYSYSQNSFLGSSKGVMKRGQISRSPDSVLLFVEETIWFFDDPATGKRFNSAVLNDTNFMPRHYQDKSNAFGDTIATYHGTSTAKPNEGKGNTVFVDGHIDLSDPWDTEFIEGKEFRRSYLLSFPGRNVKSLTKPY